MRKDRRRPSWLLRLVLLCALLAGGAIWLIVNPVLFPPTPLAAPAADAARLETDVRYLAARTPSRTAHDVAALDAAAAWIGESFAAAGCAPRERRYEAFGQVYRNVVCPLGPQTGPLVVIGAHYDVHKAPGADDNASGIAAILELARLIGEAKPALTHRLQLVAFTLEEPPHFRRETMGSFVYARDLAASGTPVKLMVSVEMVGYFSDAPGSQRYPVGALAWLYPDRGDFIGVVGRTLDRTPVGRVKALMAAAIPLPVWSINAPVALAGIDFSDHRSFWQLGLPAVMVTDTAFLRNPNYHSTTDTPDTLDYRRLAQVVDGLYQVAVGY